MSFLHASMNIRGMKYHDISNEATVEKYRITDRREGDTWKKSIINILQGNVAADINNIHHMPYFLYLEGGQCRTTSVIVDTGISPSQCIPINNDKKLFEKIKKVAPNAKYGNFNNVIRSLGIEGLKNVKYVWYDGCSTVLGNKEITPIEDVEVLLDHIAHDIVFSMTYIQRTNHPMTAYIRKRISGIPLTHEEKTKWHATKRIAKKRPLNTRNKRAGMTTEKQFTMIQNAILNKGFIIEQSYRLSYHNKVFCMFRLKKVVEI